MGKISFIHLSDIHFCKTSGKNFDIDSDLRNAVLTDISWNAKKELENVKGILIGGDIAFTGQKEEYEKAKEFLKELTTRLEIDEKDIFCVPGNHDINQAVVKGSRSVYNAQCDIEKAGTIDETDKIFEKYMMDAADPNLLFKAIEEYNNFGALYGCNINSENIFWTESFELDYEMTLKIRGMNSCIISNHDDHKDKNNIRKMIVGQSQIPSYEENTAWVSLCHHPVEFWKFAEDIQGKLDKRIDIQLYGHKHEQIVDAGEERLVISAGATQPVRGKKWNPRYNWITFECTCHDDGRILKAKVYPRVLSSDRDSFIADDKNCIPKENYFDYELNVDDKRKKNLYDVKENIDDKEKQIIIVEKPIIGNLHRNIIYCFFELSYVQQSDILSKLGLLREEYEGKKYVDVIHRILADAEKTNCLEQLYRLIKNN